VGTLLDENDFLNVIHWTNVIEEQAKVSEEVKRAERNAKGIIKEYLSDSFFKFCQKLKYGKAVFWKIGYYLWA